jgi:hypothetical protein
MVVLVKKEIRKMVNRGKIEGVKKERVKKKRRFIAYRI